MNKKKLLITGAFLALSWVPTAFMPLIKTSPSRYVAPETFKVKNLETHTNPHNYYNQEAFTEPHIFGNETNPATNENGWYTDPITGKKIIYEPFGKGYENLNENKFYKIVNGEQDFSKEYQTTISQSPSKENEYKGLTKIHINSEEKPTGKVTPLYFVFEEWANFPQWSQYEKDRIYWNDPIILEFHKDETGFYSEIETPSSSWYGLILDGYANKDYIPLDIDPYGGYLAGYNYAPTTFFQTEGSFISPTFKFNATRSEGNNSANRQELINIHENIHKNTLMFDEGFSEFGFGAGKFDWNIDMRDPSVHDNHHIGRYMHNSWDLPKEGEFYNIKNWIPEINKKWDIKFDIDLGAAYTYSDNINEILEYVKNNQVTEIGVPVQNISKRVSFNDVISGEYFVNSDFETLFTPTLANAKVKIEDGIGVTEIDPNFETKFEIDKNTGYTNIVLKEFVDIGENQIIIHATDDISGTMTVWNDLNSNNIREESENVVISIGEGSASVDKNITKWGAKRHSNPTFNKYLTGWTNVGSSWRTFNVMGPVHLALVGAGFINFVGLTTIGINFLLTKKSKSTKEN